MNELTRMQRQYHRWYSPNMAHDMELLVFGDAGVRTLVFPVRAGRFYEYEDSGIVDAVRAKIENRLIQLICVDSVDSESLYNRTLTPAERILRHLQYEQYILREVVPFTLQSNPNPFLIVHGCSMGAFHAVNFAFRHPDVVAKVVAFSGRYDLTVKVDTYEDLFDGYHDETIYFNNPLQFVPNISNEALLLLLRRMEIHLAVGESDPFLTSNRQFSTALQELGVAHSLYIWHGRAHKPKSWQQMAQLYL
jgi:esterase/lipase superfamily enzyme